MRAPPNPLDLRMQLPDAVGRICPPVNVPDGPVEAPAMDAHRTTCFDPRQQHGLSAEASQWLDLDDGTDFFRGLVIFAPVGVLFWVGLWAIWRAIP